jgi:crotonyl-CoA carboxylase/reductase
MTKQIYPVGERPPLGEVPPMMHAFTIRRERYAEPKDSLRPEVVPVPEIGDDEVLVYVMAAGVNYNNVWAAQGVPVDVIRAQQKAGQTLDFHIGGSDASGIVYQVGRNVSYPRVGDEVVLHCGTFNPECPRVKEGIDPMYSPSFKIWGYELNWGSFAQFAKVQAQQCLPRPQHLSWEESAAYMLVGATAYRMLYGFMPNTVKKGEVALIWGGAGGLGSMAIQICREAGAIPVAVVSSADKFDYCMKLGAAGCINRNDFSHWGIMPHWTDKEGYKGWLDGARAFGQAVWDIVGEKKSPALVVEHPGEATIPTSLFVCDTAGMVTICAGTSGYNASIDLRYLWMRQKRVQGAHFANHHQAAGFNDLVLAGKIDPCLGRTFDFDETHLAHQLMFENKHPHGNMAVLVGTKERDSGRHVHKNAVNGVAAAEDAYVAVPA